jgi:hypothetical protein
MDAGSCCTYFSERQQTPSFNHGLISISNNFLEMFESIIYNPIIFTLHLSYSQIRMGLFKFMVTKSVT